MPSDRRRSTAEPTRGPTTGMGVATLAAASVALAGEGLTGCTGDGAAADRSGAAGSAHETRSESEPHRIVMMHDRTLDRTTAGSGVTEEHTLAEIEALQLVDHEGTVTEHRTTSLEEVLEWAEGRTSIAVDVKAPVTFDRMIEEIVAAGAEARVFIQTYNLEDARTVLRLHPGLMIPTSIRNGATIISTDRPVEVSEAMESVVEPSRFERAPFGS